MRQHSLDSHNTLQKRSEQRSRELSADNRDNLHQAQCWFVSKSMAEASDRSAC